MRLRVQNWNYKKSAVLGWILVVSTIAISCQLVMGGVRLQETISAVQVQQTHLSRTEMAFTQSAEGTQTGEARSEWTQIPDTTASPSPTLESTTVPTGTQEGGVPDLERRLKAAKILLFENMSASGYIRYVQEALDQAGYFYLDVGSATGWFRTQLLSDVEWDLIIAAAEARRDFGGDYFELIDKRVSQGAAAIVEYWDLDFAPSGRADSLLSSCGVTYQSDWYDPSIRVFFWTQPDHPIFHEPNLVPSLGNAPRMWEGDIGDLVKISLRGGETSGDALILASTNPSWKTDHGLLVTCIEGRVVLQTFGSHEYQYEGIIALWQNYIYQTLKNRFAGSPVIVPTPVVTKGLIPTPTGAMAGPQIDVELACGEAFMVKVPKAPIFQRDLFEHHAEGTFLIVDLQLVNQTPYPIQIWDGDYFLEGTLDAKSITLTPHKAATGYLFIDSPKRLIQDLIEPGLPWRTSLAFDVDPDGTAWTLVLKPGYELGEQVCEVRVPITP